MDIGRKYGLNKPMARRKRKRTFSPLKSLVAIGSLVALASVPTSTQHNDLPDNLEAKLDVPALEVQASNPWVDTDPIKKYLPLPTAAAHEELVPYQELIVEYALLNEFSPDLIARQTWEESEGYPRAVSKKDKYGSDIMNGRADRAYGIMQIKISTGRHYGLKGTDREVIEQLFDPETSFRIGTKHLRWCVNKFGGDIAQGLMAYNAGQATVIAAHDKSTGRVVKKINRMVNGSDVWEYPTYTYHDREVRPQELPRETRLYVKDIMGDEAPGF